MSIDRLDIDLTKHCDSFPKIPQRQVARNSLIEQLAGMFSPSQRVIVVEGSESSGKTTLLAQFCQRFKNRSVSFFVGTDHWRSRPERFLEELCSQIQVLCPNVVQPDFENLDIHGLKACFDKLYRALGKQAIRHDQCFYIVIDGIDLVPAAYGGESMLTYLPSDPSDGIYILLSSTRDRIYDFELIAWPIPKLSDIETRMLLKEWLSPSQIYYVYRESKGIPGYVGEIQRQLESGLDPDEVITNLPAHLDELLMRTISKVPDDPVLRKILAIIVYSNISLSLDVLCKIASENETVVRQKLKSVSFLFDDESLDGLCFATNAHRRVISHHLKYLKPDIQQSLIKFHQQSAPSDWSHSELTLLYSQTDRYNDLVDLLNPENVFLAIENSKTTSASIRNLNVLSREAYNRDDLTGLAYSAMMESVLRYVVQRSSSLEKEIEALLAMGRYQEAVATSLQCGFPEDRLCLLARACRYMGEKQIEIPDLLIETIEETADKIKSLTDMGRRLLTAISDLFSVLPNTALRLVNQLRTDSVGTSAMEGQLMDDFLVEVSLHEGSPLRGAQDTTTDNTSEESLWEALRLASGNLSQIACTDIIFKSQQIHDTSARVYLLLEWCRVNQNEPKTLNVVEEIIKIFRQTDDYAPSPRRVRQLAQIILEANTSISDKRRIAEDLIQLRQTVTAAPIEERIRFDLLMARLENHWAPETATLKFYQLYLDCDKINDLDIRCLVLAHLLANAPKIEPEDHKLHLEIESCFMDEFEKLLTHSAEQWATTRSIIHVLTKHRKELAVQIVSLLNITERRDKGFEEVLRVYTMRKAKQVDVQFVIRVLNQISEKRRRELTLLNVLRRITRRYIFEKTADWALLEQAVKQINDHCFKALSYGYLLRGIPEMDRNNGKNTWRKILETVDSIGHCGLRLDIKLSLCIILAERYPEYAQQLFDSTREEKNVPLIASGLSGLYTQISELAVRSVTDTCKSNHRAQNINPFKQIIDRCPSPIAQVELLTDLGIRLILGDMTTEFRTNIAPTIESVLESYEKTECYPYLVLIAAPALYEYSRTVFEDRLSHLEPIMKDEALFRVLKYTLSQRAPGDPVDLERMNKTMDIHWTEKSCRVLEQLTTDNMFFTGLTCLIDKLVHKIPGGKELCVLDERHSLNFATQLAESVERKLPDSRNIKHDGFKIVAHASLCRLRSAAENRKPFRAHKDWENICPSYNDLTKQARKIPNLADKVLVLAEIGANMYYAQPSKGKRVLDEAAELIKEIATQTDRFDKYVLIATSFAELGITKSAEFYIEKAFDEICSMSKDSTVDGKLQSVLELAHTISPEFASNLASKTDDARIRYRAESGIRVQNLKADPRRVNSDTSYLQPRTMKAAARTILRDLCSERAAITHDTVIKEWLKHAPRHDFETVHAILAWFVENTAKRLEQSSKSGLDPLLNRLFWTLEILNPLCEFASGSTRPSVLDANISSSLNIMTFPAGQQGEVKKTLEQFLAKHGSPYVKIHDPYFGPTEIGLLKSVPMDTQVAIMTSTRDVSKGSEPESFRREWRKASSQEPPPTDVFIYLTEQNKTPLHDRFILCKNAGLWIGTSINSLGRKDTHIKFLSEDEKHKIETETVDRLLSQPPLYHEGERLKRRVFTL